MKKCSVIIQLFALLGFIFLVQFSFDLTKAQEAKTGSLYERLGGSFAISAVVDDFVERLLADPIITANKKVMSEMEKVNKAGLKFHITEMVCEEAGGPQKYTGRPMKESHETLGITETEWQAMVKDFLATLKKFNVPEKEQNELIAIVGKSKSDIVKAEPEPALKARELPTEKVQAAPPVEQPQVKEESLPRAPEPEIPGLEDLPEPVE